MLLEALERRPRPLRRSLGLGSTIVPELIEELGRDAPFIDELGRRRFLAAESRQHDGRQRRDALAVVIERLTLVAPSCILVLE
jgi:hypothetical protein